ncbi:MAG: heme-binding protein [Candidatus Nitrotoga sp.]|nr:heme-binding protein [Candidatus Nitrotoga sp.]MDP1854550.1 heme-binding protein [Candidatus Nitrotoga sp.]
MSQIIAGLQNLSAANLNVTNDFIALGGGVPIQVEGETISAIGIGGAPGGHLDEQCAEAGIAKIKDRLK